MAIEAISYFVRQYKMLSGSSLQAYRKTLSKILFNLKNPDAEIGQLRINSDGYWRYSDLLWEKSNKINPKTARTKNEAIEIANTWLQNSYEKIQKAIDEKKLPEDFNEIIPRRFLRVESVEPVYKENSHYVEHWDVRYLVEFPYNPDYKARFQGQYVSIKSAMRVVGVDFNSRVPSEKPTASALIVPALLQAIDNIFLAQFPDFKLDEESVSFPILPIVFLLQNENAKAFWLAQDGQLVPATKEGEPLALFTAISPQKEESGKILWENGTAKIQEKVDYLRTYSPMFAIIFRRLDNNIKYNFIVSLLTPEKIIIKKKEEGFTMESGGWYKNENREIALKENPEYYEVVEEFFHAYQALFYGYALTKKEKDEILLNRDVSFQKKFFQFTNLMNISDQKLFIENEAKLFTYLVLNEVGVSRKEYGLMPLVEAKKADKNNSGVMTGGAKLHEKLQKEIGENIDIKEPIVLSATENEQQISLEFFTKYQQESKNVMLSSGYKGKDFYKSPFALNSTLLRKKEGEDNGYAAAEAGIPGEYFIKYIVETGKIDD